MKKYRFSDLVGNTNSIGLLRRTLMNESFSQFSIFCGPYGTGKSTCARIAAMALTCENPEEGQPCLECPTCKANMRAFETTGESGNVKVINVGELNTKSDVSELINKVFVLQASRRNCVYVFEEAHALKYLGSAQTALLEELDRMPPNTYIIMCTTNQNDLLEALKSRALKIQFSKLRPNESRMLLLQTARDLGRLQVSEELARLITTESQGIPRKIVNSVEFILNNQVTEEEYREFVHDISDTVFVLMFRAAAKGDLAAVFEQLSELLECREAHEVFRALKDFLVRVLFCVEGGVTGEFSREDAVAISRVFDTKSVQRIGQMIGNFSHGISEADLKLLVYRMALAVQGRGTVEVLRENSSVAAEKSATSRMRAIENDRTAVEGQEVKLHGLKLSSLASFGGEKL